VVLAWANATKASMTGSQRSVFQASFLHWLPGVGASHRPAPAGLDRRGLAALGDLAGHATFGEQPAVLPLW
jgi:hypothetical protein